MTLSEKVAYLKGLAEGLKISAENDQGRVITEIIGVLSDVADSVSAIEEECDRLNEYVEEIDEDLGDVEEAVYGDEEDDDEYDDYDDEDYDEEEEDEEDYDDDVIEIECPNCGETICVPPTVDYAHLICPACNEEFSYIEDDEGPTDED